MADLETLLAQLRLSGEWVTHVTAWHTFEARPAVYAELPPELHPRLVHLLHAQGIERLYLHQVLAVRHVWEGRDVVVVTPAASGKTLCYNLPVLDAWLRDPETCALYLFPTKALAHDQLDALERAGHAAGIDLPVAAYDGDTPASRRASVRQNARILFSNPDMLHTGILPHHVQWRQFLSRLRYIVIDEMHHYRGIFGSHVANVLRRLERICRFYGSQPQFIGCSATIANPVELALRLLGRPATLVSRDGAPRGRRNLVFYNPPIVNRTLGLRRSVLLEACDLASHLLKHGLQTIIFGRSRLSVELCLSALRQEARRLGLDQAALRGYRGGYLPSERRAIEQGLRTGAVRGVVATNALELGVDIGSLAACVMIGYPGTIASTWQQVGRVGRRCEDSVAFLIASSTPLDQYIISHPDYFLAQSPEHALMNPDNPYVLLGHLACAAFELPFTADERYGGEDIREILQLLAEEGQLRDSRGMWYWTGDNYPAAAVSLRTADPHSVTIVEQTDGGERRTIGQLERSCAPRLLHEGAIYFHDGQQYAVRSLHWDEGWAEVQAVAVDYYTEPSVSRRITIERIASEIRRPSMSLAFGEVTLTSRVTGYRRLRMGSLEHLSWGEVDLPEQQVRAWACWMGVLDHVVNRLREEGWWMGDLAASRGPSWPTQRDLARRRDGFRCRWCGAPERPGRQHHVHHIVPFREFKWVPQQNENHAQANHLSNLITLCPTCHRRAEQQVAVQSTLSGLGHVLANLVPLFLMCDPGDIEILADVDAQQTGLPTLFVIDRVPGGVGLSEGVLSLYGELLDKADELVRDCPCAQGCPSCIGPSAISNPKGKQQVRVLIAALRDYRDPCPSP